MNTAIAQKANTTMMLIGSTVAPYEKGRMRDSVATLPRAPMLSQLGAAAVHLLLGATEPRRTERLTPAAASAAAECDQRAITQLLIGRELINNECAEDRFGHLASGSESGYTGLEDDIYGSHLLFAEGKRMRDSVTALPRALSLTQSPY
jgi:hypothetical protein